MSLIDRTERQRVETVRELIEEELQSVRLYKIELELTLFDREKREIKSALKMHKETLRDMRRGLKRRGE